MPFEKGLTVDAIDISPKMIELAKRNPSNLGVNYRVGDFCALDGGGYDYLLVFDSYQHFIDKQKFCKAAYRLLKVGGELWIFFDQSKESINARHIEKADDVSVALLPAEQEAKVFQSAFDVVYLRDDIGYYLGLKKKSDKIFD